MTKASHMGYTLRMDEPADTPLLATWHVAEGPPEEREPSETRYPPDFTPVPIKTLAGWTPAKQQMFIDSLTATGSVRMATDSVGMSQTHVYKLRTMPGGESFARAWDEAVAIGARRVRDVLIDQAIHGIPERTLLDRDTVVERRRFNHRTMIWVLQHHLPDEFPGGSTTHRRGWKGTRDGEAHPSVEEVRAEMVREVEALRRPRMRAIAADPEKRAAYELLNGPQDWAALERGGAAPD